VRIQFIQDLIDKVRRKGIEKYLIPVKVIDVYQPTIDILFEKFAVSEFEINGQRRKYLTDVNADQGVTEQALCLLCEQFPAGSRIGTRVLNVGCGKKSQNDFLSTLGFDVYGIDYDIDADSERVRFHDLNTQDGIPFKDISFDAIICQEIIEHIENPWLLFRKVKASLKLNGIFVVTTPNISSNASKKVFIRNNNGFFSYFDPINLWQHINPIPFWEMIHISKFNGFELVRLSGSNEYYLNYIYKNGEPSPDLRQAITVQNNNVLHYVFRNINDSIKLYNPTPTYGYTWS
jgi:SAM-dependent methyltransferase